MKRVKLSSINLSYFIVIVGIPTLLFFYSRLDSDWVSNTLGNVGSELIGIIITVFLIDLVVKYQDEKKKKKVERNVLENFGKNLNSYLSFLISLSNDSNEEKKYKLSETINDNLISKLIIFDFEAKSQHITECNWYEMLRINGYNLHNSIERLLDKYILYFSEDLIINLHELQDSLNFIFPHEVFNVIKETAGYDPVLFNQALLIKIKPHFICINNFISYYNANNQIFKLDETTCLSYKQNIKVM